MMYKWYLYMQKQEYKMTKMKKGKKCNNFDEMQLQRKQRKLELSTLVLTCYFSSAIAVFTLDLSMLSFCCYHILVHSKPFWVA